ncbi:hypothetical protein ACLMJK_002092 [Lecanora helva]
MDQAKTSKGDNRLILSRANAPFEYNVDDTRVRLEISTAMTNPTLPERDVLMCIIEAMGKLEETHAGDPIDDNKLTFNYTWVQIILEDQGRPTGRFLNDIASWTLRGIAEWMAKNEWFRVMSVKVYFNNYFCGVAEVGLLNSNGAVSSAPSATAPSTEATSLS